MKKKKQVFIATRYFLSRKKCLKKKQHLIKCITKGRITDEDMNHLVYKQN